MQQDEKQLERDRQLLRQYQQQAEQYKQELQERVSQAESARPGVEQKLEQMKKQFKSGPELQSMLNRPGSQMYVLSQWLKRESAIESRAKNLLGWTNWAVERQQARVQQDQYNLDQDQSSLRHEQGIEQEQKAEKADAERQQKEAEYWHGSANDGYPNQNYYGYYGYYGGWGWPYYSTSNWPYWYRHSSIAPHYTPIRGGFVGGGRR